MIRYALTVLLLSFSLSIVAQSYTIETVPNTKLVNNSYVSNPDGIIQEATVTQLNSLLDSLERKTSAQVAVVLLNSIGDLEVFDFAQQLFVKWGIGQAGNDNGLLILFVMDKRKVRIHTGKGLEGVLPDAVCKEIERQYMVPSFKEGNYDAGMLSGVQRVASLLTNPEAANEIMSTQEETSTADAYEFFMWFIAIIAGIFYFIAAGSKKFTSSPETPAVRISKMRWVILYVVFPYALLSTAYFSSWSGGAFFLALYSYLIFILLEKYFRVQSIAKPFLEKGEYQTVYNFYGQRNWGVAAFFFPFPFLLLYFLFKIKRRRIRAHSRPCKKCKTIIPSRLSEQTEDEFLQPGQQVEEKIGVIDYDVWKCNACGSVEVLNYPNSKSKYSRCPQCNFLTDHLDGKRTTQSATYEADGNGEEAHTCLNCGHHHIVSFIIPMLVASSSSSSDSSSSSSDSGGSWGGGDSGGGGAESSW